MAEISTIHHKVWHTQVLYIIAYDWHKYYTSWGMTDTISLYSRFNGHKFYTVLGMSDTWHMY